jgi:hypothetical protein
MKRIYMALALISGLAFGAKAQTIDLWTFADVDSCIHLGENFDTVSSAAKPLGIYGIASWGPDMLQVGDQVLWKWSFSHYLTEAEAAAQTPPVPFEDRYFWLTGSTLQQDIPDSSYVAVFSFDKIDSISMLLDWNRWQQYGLDSIRLYGPPHETFVNGQAYGFFVHVYGVDDASNPLNTDNDKTNNWAVQKVIWNSPSCTRTGGTSIGDILVPKEKESLTIYPNPATTEFSFDYALPVYSMAHVSITDVTGRVVYRKGYGNITPGAHKYTVDISKLTPGMYTVEFQTDEKRAITKLTVK